MRDRGMNLNTDTGDKMTDRTATTFTDNILRRSTSSAECSEVQSTNQRPPKELGSKSATNQLQYYNGKVIALCMQHLEHWNRYKVVQASLTRIYYGFLTFGTQRAQLVHLTYLTWPRPCFDRPQFRLFCVCVQRSENKRSKNFPKWYLWASKNKKHRIFSQPHLIDYSKERYKQTHTTTHHVDFTTWSENFVRMRKNSSLRNN